MTGLPRQAVWIAAALVVLMAAIGAYQGWIRSASGPADSPTAVGASITPGNTATKAATALEEPAEPLPEALTEARVRTIARQEIQTALNPQPAPAPAPSQPAIPTPAPLTLTPVAPRPAPPSDPAGEAGLLSGARP